MTYNVSDEVMLFVGVVVLAMCITIDISIAINRRAKWIPGYAVIIYALFLQLVGSLDAQNVSFGNVKKDQQLKALVSNQLSIYSSRLVLLVFVGYLVPHLASINGFWTNIAALFTSLLIHISSELSVTLQSRASEKDKVVKSQSGIWLIVSGFVMLESTFYISCLIGWAISRGGFIRDNLSSRIPLAFETSLEDISENESYQSEMLKAWIVARVSQPEYVLGRSFFSLEVACLVTVNVVFMGIKVVCLRSQLHGPWSLFTLQCIFIILGWVVVCYRCFLRYGKPEAVAASSWQERIALACRRARVSDIFSLMRYVSPIFVFREKILKDVKSPICRSLVQIGFGLFSFLYLLPSTIVILGWIGAVVILFVCHPIIEFRRRKFYSRPREDGDFGKYKKALEEVCMPGDEAESLWVANESSFNHMKKCIEQACERGKSREELQKVIGRRLAQDIPLKEDVKELLEPLESVKKYFPLLKDSFRRITALALLMDDSVSEDSMRKLKGDVRTAFEEVGELMDFLDCPDNVGISVDVFKTSNLEAFMLRYASIGRFQNVRFNFSESSTVANAVEKLLDEERRTLETFNLLEGFNPHVVDTNWHRAAEPYAIYKVCKTILDRQGEGESVEQLQSYLINMLADLIAMCVTESPRILVERSRKWAAEFREDKICAAIELVGFACGVMDGVNAASPSTTIDYSRLFSYA